LQAVESTGADNMENESVAIETEQPKGIPGIYG